MVPGLFGVWGGSISAVCEAGGVLSLILMCGSGSWWAFLGGAAYALGRLQPSPAPTWTCRLARLADQPWGSPNGCTGTRNQIFSCMGRGSVVASLLPYSEPLIMGHRKPSVCLAVLSTKNKELCAGAAWTELSPQNEKYQRGSGARAKTGLPCPTSDEPLSQSCFQARGTARTHPSLLLKEKTKTLRLFP